MFFSHFSPLSIRVTLLSFLLCGLAACGGGGGSSVKTPGTGGAPVSSLSASSINSSANSSMMVSSSVSSLASSSLFDSLSSSLSTSLASSLSTSLASSLSSSSISNSSIASSANVAAGLDLLSSAANSSLSSSSQSFAEPEPLPLPCSEGLYRFDGVNCTYSNMPLPVYSPAADEVVIYFNSKEKQFAGYTVYLWSLCGSGWADSQTDGVNTFTAPYDWLRGPGVTSGDWQQDPLYGAYFVLKIKPEGTCGDFIIRSPGLASQTLDLKVDIAFTGSPLDRTVFVVESPEGLTKSLSSSRPVCFNDEYPSLCKLWQEFPESPVTAPEAFIDPQAVASDRESRAMTSLSTP